MKMKKFDKDMESVKVLIRENLRDVHKILSDVPAENSFWFRNGVIVNNIQEMPAALEVIDEETFAYHVNKGKNDIANWIRDIVGDKDLADSVVKLKRRKSMINRIRGRIQYFNNIKG